MQVKYVYKISNYKNIQVLSHPIPKLQVQVLIPSVWNQKPQSKPCAWNQNP